MRRFSQALVTLLAAITMGGIAKARLQISPSTPWQAFSDKFAGGTSSVQIKVLADGSNSYHAVRMEGKLTHYFISPFAGIQANFRIDASPQDAGRYYGVQFWVRGDGHRYIMQVHTASVKDYNYFSESFPTTRRWVLVKIPFKDLRQTMPGGKNVPWTASDLTGIAFEASGFLGSFWMEVGKVSLYR